MAMFEDHQDIMEATLSRYRLPQNVSMATVEEGHLRLMFLGIAACGKSSTGNTILGNITFETGNCPEPVTTHVCEASQLVHGCHVTAIDTPPRWTPPKPTEYGGDVDVYVLVVSLARPRFTLAQLREIQDLRNAQGDNILESKRCLLVLTHADSVLSKTTLADYIETVDGSLGLLIKGHMGSRVMAVNNVCKTSYETQEQRRALLSLAQSVRKMSSASAPDVTSLYGALSLILFFPLHFVLFATKACVGLAAGVLGYGVYVANLVWQSVRLPYWAARVTEFVENSSRKYTRYVRNVVCFPGKMAFSMFNFGCNLLLAVARYSRDLVLEITK